MRPIKLEMTRAEEINVGWFVILDNLDVARLVLLLAAETIYLLELLTPLGAITKVQ